jgi:hypothetical protein
MLDYSISIPEGILEVSPHAPLSEEDFHGINAAVDAYLADHAKLHGVLIHAKGFPGWEDFGGLAAHMQFIRQHHQSIERLAIVTDSHFATVATALGKHFTSAEVRHFPFDEEDEALNWLELPARQSTSAKSVRAAP